MFEEGALLGLADDDAVQLNPPMERVIGAADKAVVVAKSRHGIRIRKGARDEVDAAAIRNQQPAPASPRRVSEAARKHSRKPAATSSACTTDGVNRGSWK